MADKKRKIKMTNPQRLTVKNQKGNVARKCKFKTMLVPEKAMRNKIYEPAFNQEEVRKATKSLQNGKSTGIDNIPVELIKLKFK